LRPARSASVETSPDQYLLSHAQKEESYTYKTPDILFFYRRTHQCPNNILSTKYLSSCVSYLQFNSDSSQLEVRHTTPNFLEG
jgi:hypothetical protein